MRISELKKKTKYKACGKVGHWAKDFVCFKDNKDGDSNKAKKPMPSKGGDASKNEAHDVVSEEYDDEDAYTIIVYVDECPYDDG